MGGCEGHGEGRDRGGGKGRGGEELGVEGERRREMIGWREGAQVTTNRLVGAEEEETAPKHIAVGSRPLPFRVT